MSHSEIFLDKTLTLVIRKYQRFF